MSRDYTTLNIDKQMRAKYTFLAEYKNWSGHVQVIQFFSVNMTEWYADGWTWHRMLKDSKRAAQDFAVTMGWTLVNQTDVEQC